MRRFRSLAAAVVVVAVCAVIGGFFGRGALAAQDRVPDQYRVFTAALAAVEAEYAGEVESDRLVYGAIGGMLVAPSLATGVGSVGGADRVQVVSDSPLGTLEALGQKLEESGRKIEAAERSGDTAGQMATALSPKAR